MNQRYFSIIDFAALLKLHPNTIRRAIKDNRISALRIGKGEKACYRIPESEIHRIAQLDLDKVIEKEVNKRISEGKNAF